MKTKGLSIIILLVLLVAVPEISSAQDVLNGIYVKEKTLNRKPVPYQYLREADVMWSKTVWRMIPLREKLNHSLYYPENPIGDRMSLIDLLLWGVRNQGLTAYDEAEGDEFATVMTVKEIEEKFDAKDQKIMVEDVENPDGPMIEQTIEGDIISSEVKSYLVKELWFFDKQRSVLDVRIIGICPIREYTRENMDDGSGDDENAGMEEMKRKKLFWVYFPEARKILASHEVFNPFNDAERMSFDDLFYKRFFSSYIVQESNSYDNRPISDYTIGLESLLEAERIKESIFNFEQDLWVY